MPTQRAKIAIIGGGIGGLAAALALHRAGIDVEVYEQASRITEIGAGLNLSPNALLALRMLDVEDEAIAAGYRDDEQLTRHFASGAVMSRQPRDEMSAAQYGAGYLTIHRADMQAILLRHLPAERVYLAKSCVNVENVAGGAIARFADGTSVQANAIIGADGIHSKVREALFGPQPPRFTGCVCWRGLVAVDAIADIPQFRNMAAWWGPSGHVVHYLVRRGEMVNFVAHYDSENWTDESWTQECSRDELLEAFKGWNEDLLKLFALSERYYKWALYDRDPLPQWGKGAITLLGDAAHPMLPYLGQGAAMAMEDGCILARIIQQETNVEAALRLYESLRQSRTAQVQLASRARAKEYHLKSPFERWWRNAKLALRRRFGADRTTLRAGWVYDYDVAKILLERP